jgi:protein-disulfide isomerase-like protein with CxxC motif
MAMAEQIEPLRQRENPIEREHQIEPAHQTDRQTLILRLHQTGHQTFLLHRTGRLHHMEAAAVQWEEEAVQWVEVEAEEDDKG